MDHTSLPGFFLCGKATVENFWTPLLLFGFQMSCSLYPNILRILLKVPIESFCTPTFQGPVLLLLRPSFCTPTFQGPVLLLLRPSLCTPTFLPPRKHPRLSPSCCTPPPSPLFLPKQPGSKSLMGEWRRHLPFGRLGPYLDVTSNVQSKVKSKVKSKVQSKVQSNRLAFFVKVLYPNILRV